MNSFPWLEILESCPSTNSWAIANADHLTHGSVVFTPQQTAGRGQHGRTWVSPKGVLTASFITDRFPIQQLTGFSLAVGLAVIEAVETLVPSLQTQLQLKWSNDVLLQNRKLAGILCETSISSRAQVARVIVGIGLNRCAELNLERAISLHEVASAVPDDFAFLDQLRRSLLQMSDRVAKDGLGAVLPELQQRDMLCDRDLTIDLAGNLITGKAAGIDAQGRLLLRLQDQSIQTFTSGHILRWH